MPSTEQEGFDAAEVAERERVAGEMARLLLDEEQGLLGSKDSKDKGRAGVHKATSKSNGGVKAHGKGKSQRGRS